MISLITRFKRHKASLVFIELLSLVHYLMLNQPFRGLAEVERSGSQYISS